MIKPKAPEAPQKRFTSQYHQITLSDPYHWLRDPGYPDVKDPEILAYLEAENHYFEDQMAPLGDLTETIFSEIKGRIKEDDAGVPWQKGAYDLRWTFEAGAQYRTWFKRPRTQDPYQGDGWTILYDENAAAEGLDYFRLRSLTLSEDGTWLATATDTNGSERYDVQVQNLTTGTLLDLKITDTSGELVWARDGSGLYCVEVSQEWRPYKVWFHPLDGSDPTLVFEETSGQYFVHISASGPGASLLISAAGHTSSEVYWIPLDQPSAAPHCFAPRRELHDYKVAEIDPETEDGLPRFVILSNKDTVNFDLFRIDDWSAGEADWVKIRSGSDSRYLRGFTAMKHHILVEETNDGRQDICVMTLNGEALYAVAFEEEVRSASVRAVPEYDTPFARLSYESLTVPQTVYDLDLATGALTLRKEQDIPSGYDRTAYQSERIMVTARDGARVPVSLVYKKGWARGGKAPVHLYGYGAYGIAMDPSFSVSRLSLLDRGFVYAIAHIRGGDDMGYQWYLDGKLDVRTNTFHDFVDAARALIDQGVAEKGRISISGGSAGGELMGAVLNDAPDLFGAAVLHVPFVDVLNTMLDETLPLTPMEWPEWGNPIEDKAAFDFIRSYCPYTNIKAQDYPPMMITGGLNDPRVTYWEPAKWTAKIRAMKTDDYPVIMKMNMGAGHGGKSGRFERIREVAEEYAFCHATLEHFPIPPSHTLQRQDSFDTLLE